MIELFVGLGSLVVGVLGKWLVDRHVRSGRVDTTDAETLWQEQRDFREQMREELEKRVQECKDQVKAIQLQNLELRIENHELRADNMRLQFLTHPEIPQEVKDEFLEHQRVHILKLKTAYAEATKLREENAS